ncbi:MAG: DUF502 domain-containing protein [Gammaproteobacteria bacterium]
MSYLRRYIMAGLLVWVPIWITLLVLRFIVELLNSTVAMLPKQFRPEQILGFHVPGLGVVISLSVLIFTGILVSNIIGHGLVAFGESIVKRIPLVRSIHSSVKQVLYTLFSPDGHSFRHVLLVEYPRKGLWSIAFQTAQACDGVKEHAGEDTIAVFIPTTPNPTSGFLVMVPRKDVKVLDMSVDDGLKMVISLGVVQPEHLPVKQTPMPA